MKRDDIISRKQAIESAKFIYESDCELKGISVLKMLQELPSVIQTGYWIDDFGNQMCSNCGTAYPDLYPDYFDANYCPHCGIAMLKEEDDHDN